MNVTRRYWTIAGFGGVLAGAAVLYARPALLVGAAALGAWLLARQYAFVRALDRATDDLAIDVTPLRGRAPTDDPVPVELRASLAEPTTPSLAIEARPGVVARSPSSAERTVSIPRGEESGTTDFEVAWPVAGSFPFDPSNVSASDPHELFAASVPRSSDASVVVEPRGPTEVHVGAGGDRIAAVYGEHDTGRLGSGLDPAELREYMPGDTARQIDWKATARRGYPHVREYEVQADYTTVIFVDRRPSMQQGAAGETPLEYARHVALAICASAREFNDPLGLCLVGEEKIISYSPDGGTSQYAAIRERLRELDSGAADRAANSIEEVPTPGPAVARRRAALLAGEGTAFGRTLRPFLSSTDAHVERVATDPLFEAAKRAVATTREATRTVLFTDDTGRAETRETVKLARRNEGHVLVFLTPQVLFEPGGLADMEDAYERYVDFEEFRRELARLERVSAFEIAPGDRLEGVLAAGRNTRRREHDRDRGDRDGRDDRNRDREHETPPGEDPDRDSSSREYRSVIA
jgi:uncharacterized protein (DUF58 family)